LSLVLRSAAGRRRRVVVAAPGLLDLDDDSLARDATLARFASLASPAQVEPGGLEVALAGMLGVGQGTAPFAAVGARIGERARRAPPGFEAQERWIAHADPIHVDVGHDDALVHGRVDTLDRAEADALVASLDGLLQADGIRIVAPRADCWFAVSEEAALDVPASVDAVIGHSLLARSDPSGSVGVRDRRHGEIEMLLHDHPVNAARAERGEPTVDALWFWGGGRAADRLANDRSLCVCADDSRVGSFARGVAMTQRAPVAAIAESARLADLLAATGAATTVVVATLPNREAAPGLIARWVTPALSMLAARTIGELVLMADGRGGTAVWCAVAPGFVRRIRSRMRVARFERPRAATP
jgi:hypothetical protein